MTLTVFVRSPHSLASATPRSDPAESPALTFEELPISIGRTEGCEIWLPHVAVSSHHASIRYEAEAYWVVDEGSEQGTFLAATRLPAYEPRAIEDGDLLRVGPFVLQLQMDAEGKPSRPMATRDLALALVHEALDAVGKFREPAVVVRRGIDEGKRLSLKTSHAALTLGRAPDADLVLRDPDASRRHVEVGRRGDVVWIRDLGSKNGTRLQGQRLVPFRETPWPPGAEVEFSSNVFGCEDPITEAIADLAVSPVPASVVAAFERSAEQPGSLVAPLLRVAISPPPGVRFLSRFLSRFLPSWLRQGLRGATTERVIVMIGLLVLGLGAVAVWLLFQG